MLGLQMDGDAKMARPAIQFQRVIILPWFRAGAERYAAGMRYHQPEIIRAQHELRAVALDDLGKLLAAQIHPGGGERVEAFDGLGHGFSLSRHGLDRFAP